MSQINEFRLINEEKILSVYTTVPMKALGLKIVGFKSALECYQYAMEKYNETKTHYPEVILEGRAVTDWVKIK